MTDASLTADDLSGMRTTLNTSLPDTCTIARDTQVPDGAGGWTVTTATSAALDCRLSPTGGAEQVIADRLDVISAWTVTLPWNTDVTAKDRIVIGSRTFEVQTIAARRSWELSTRCVCLEIL